VVNGLKTVTDQKMVLRLVLMTSEKWS